MLNRIQRSIQSAEIHNSKMTFQRCLSLSFCFLVAASASDVKTVNREDDDNGDETFPPEFSFGVATAAYQIEGGWDADGRGPSIWDTFTHEHPEMITDRSNADIGPNSYYLFDEDLKALKELGVNFYRFSISWARVLPKGDKSSLNPAGIEYYNTVINKLIENSIRPMITMYHYDLPQELQKLGGLANPLFIEYFEEYADVLFSNFGDRVKTWITFNQPHVSCLFGYGKAHHPPFANASGIGEYLCMHHIIKAHALAYRLYKRNYFTKQQGQIGIAFNSLFFYSKTNDSVLVDRAIQFMLGWAAKPIFGEGNGYPEVMVKEIEINSLLEGRTKSRLPSFDDEWIGLIQGSSDFLGLNYYTSFYVDWAIWANQSLDYDSKVMFSTDPNWKKAKSFWIHAVPWGLGDILRWIKNEYNNTEVIITENGWSDDGQLDDDDRISYMKDHLKEVSNAIKSGCNVSAYTVWSLIDNFEWLYGYTEKFGLYAVNMTSPNKERTPKKSAQVYKSIIKTRKISE